MNKHLRGDVFASAAATLAHGLDEIFVRSTRQSFSDLKAAYDAFAAELFDQEAAFALEARRRIAERIFATAIAKKLPLPQCQRCLSEIVRLGFTDLVQECTIRIIYC